ncbi:hypothetical protein G8A07_23695 [Roseateles sp. DAIF2]|uniref:GIN domain-containing protein n=1 Tax=Roseateles sp. DAIF2 TaxID=2714952 RepID=UPI0018A2FE2B|nr:DUF2807 domain-containing protein [Roseateles sp. DAIF2]QPF75621.1 hypothetical protein G8A07_23695 [Roseateles sp. DAIF2]
MRRRCLLGAAGSLLLAGCAHEQPPGRRGGPLLPERLIVDGPLELRLEQGAPGELQFDKGGEQVELRRERDALLLLQRGDRMVRARLSQPGLRELQLRGEARVALQRAWQLDSLDVELSGSGRFEAERLDARRVALRLQGSGDLALRELHSERLEVLIGGSGTLKLGRLQTQTLEARLRASGEFEVAGSAQRQLWHLAGSGDVDAGGLQGGQVQLRSYGSGDAELGPAELLELELFGSGDVVYRGRPRVSQRSHGSGRARAR